MTPLPTAISDNPTGRERLVDATLSCLAELGPKGTTVRRIAEEADVTAGLVRHHFQSKDALFLEAYQAINRAAQQRMKQVAGQPSEDHLLVLQQTIRAFFPADLQDRKLMRIHIAFWGLVLTDPAIAAVQRDTYSDTLKLFSDLIRHIAGSSQAAEDIAVGVISISDGLWLECCLNPERMTPKRAITIVTDFTLARLKNPKTGSGD